MNGPSIFQKRKSCSNQSLGLGLSGKVVKSFPAFLSSRKCRGLQISNESRLCTLHFSRALLPALYQPPSSKNTRPGLINSWSSGFKNFNILRTEPSTSPKGAHQFRLNLFSRCGSLNNSNNKKQS